MSDSCSLRARAARAGARLALTRVHGREAGLGVGAGDVMRKARGMRAQGRKGTDN